MLCAFAAPEAQDHEQGGAQGGHGGGMAPWAGEFEVTGFSFHLTCEFEGAHRLSSFSKVHQDLSEKVVCQTYHPPNHADYHQGI